MNETANQTHLVANRVAAPCVVIVLPGLGAGGSEHVVSLVANHWARLGFDLTIITLEPPEAKPYYDFVAAISIIRVGVPPKRASRLSAAWMVFQRIRRLRSAIRHVDPDFVLSFLTRTNVLALLSTIGTGIPVIVSERNNPEVQPFGRPWRWLQKALYPRAFGLVAMTAGAMEHFPKRTRRRSWIIPNAVDLPIDWKNKRGGGIVAAVGRLTHQKGFDILLDAFAKIESSFPEWRLVIWGDGEDRAKLEAQRRTLGLEDRVEMPGVTAKPGQWGETTDGCVLSSRYEGWGIVLLEAMAAGLPVISFDCKWGPATMITHGEDGWLVPPENADALAESLSRLLSDDVLRTGLAEKAAETAKRYSKERILEQWDGVAYSVPTVVSALRCHGAEDGGPSPKS
jgi:glycosyltransferase involved in cell wall biosynthesis